MGYYFLLQAIKWSSFIVYAHIRLLVWDLFILAVKSVHISRIRFSSFFQKQSKGQCIAGNYTLLLVKVLSYSQLCHFHLTLYFISSDSFTVRKWLTEKAPVF